MAAAALQRVPRSEGFEQWARGENANPSSEALEKLRQAILTVEHPSGASYLTIFYMKDVIRSETFVAMFIEQADEKNRRARGAARRARTWGRS